MSVSFDGFDKIKVIRELWQASTFHGYQGNGIDLPMSDSEIQSFLNENNQNIDYLFGKMLKIDFKDFPIVDSKLYEKDAGDGTMQKVLEKLQKEMLKDINVKYTNTDSIVRSVIDKFIQRAEFGKKKYNNDLDRSDLDVLQWIQHAQEEHMDAILYLEKLKTFYN